MRHFRWLGVLGALVTVATAGVAVAAGPVAGRARSAATVTCRDQYPSHRDPSNPLMLAKAPGSNPLTGARYFVDGPAYGAAAGAIARLLGIDASVPAGHRLPSFPDNESWATFKRAVAQMLPSHQAVAAQVGLLEKIAGQPEAQRFSSAPQGGAPTALADFASRLFCHNFTADPGTVPIITTDFLHISLGGCPSTAQIDAYMPLFKQRIDTIVASTGNRPVVFLLEVDAIGSSSCIEHDGAMPAWEAALRYEVDQFATLPHAVVYVEAGYSDANSPAYTAAVLNQIDIQRVRGFFTNDSHNQWTINEIKWGEAVSSLTHGAHFVINTAQNGQGPLLNKYPRTQGVEQLCNPPGRGLGPTATTATGAQNVDAFLWTEVPGNSGGSCGGGPPAGTFWPTYAEGLAARANGQLGPGYPSKPY